MMLKIEEIVMSENNSYNNNEARGVNANVDSGNKLSKIFISLLLGIAILGTAGYISFKWVTNRPHAKRKPPVVKAALVEVSPVNITNHNVTVQAMGTVIPARTLDLASRVSGEIVSVSDEFFPGGHLNAGDIVAKIDKKDYLLILQEAKFALEKANLGIEQRGLAIEQSALAIEQSELAIEQSRLTIDQRKSDIIKAERDLTIEKGQQKIAKREYEVLGETIDKNDEELVLRKPQLKAAEAAVDSAKSRLKEAEAAKKSAEAAKKSAEAKMKSEEAAKKSAIAEKSKAAITIEKAELNLERTDVHAPFNAIIQAQKVEIGSQISAGAPIVTIIDSDEYWIEVSIPVDRLRWIKIPTASDPTGSNVRIFNESGWGKDLFRTGSVKRLMTEIESQGRMAKILVSVKDPLSLDETNADQPQMILGSYLRVEIAGNELADIVRVPRASLRDKDRVWIMKPDNTLDVRDVDVVWSDNDSVYVTNSLKNGEMIITSDLPAPVNGMGVRLPDPEGTSSEEKDNE